MIPSESIGFAFEVFVFAISIGICLSIIFCLTHYFLHKDKILKDIKFIADRLDRVERSLRTFNSKSSDLNISVNKLLKHFESEEFKK